jgi:hypothetical protein
MYSDRSPLAILIQKDSKSEGNILKNLQIWWFVKFIAQENFINFNKVGLHNIPKYSSGQAFSQERKKDEKENG